jgi:SAM-dependent MidA family methyltransferase
LNPLKNNSPLEQIIIEKIKKQGPITFETFMDMALYYPGLGYYTSPEVRIGKKGDFYTSPHLHPIFGAMLARQLEEMWIIMGKPSQFHTIEIGAGAGYICNDILESLKYKDVFHAINYIITELNPVAVENQKKLLAAFSDKVKWVSSLKELGNIRGCIFSNELLDAFPVHIIEMRDELKEVYIDRDDKLFYEQYQGFLSSDIIHYIKLFSLVLPHGYRTEINLRIKEWLKEIEYVLSEGFLLTIDYGYTAREYYDESRSRGTLLCYHKHRLNENSFQNIGKQDITAHVNFSSLKIWGEEVSLKTVGYCSQGTFLLALGIDELITDLYRDSPEYESEVLKIKGLFLPQGMGESHKVMVQYKGKGMPGLRGFSIRNLVKSL